MLKLQAEFTNMLVLTEINEPPAGCLCRCTLQTSNIRTDNFFVSNEKYSRYLFYERKKIIQILIV